MESGHLKHTLYEYDVDVEIMICYTVLLIISGAGQV